MRRFFLALRVRRQPVARALPDEIQPPQGPADGAVGEPDAGTQSQGLLKPRHGPGRLGEAQLLGRAAEQLAQEGRLVVAQQARAPRPLAVR